MARLTGKERKDLPTKDFAGPARSYPINDMATPAMRSAGSASTARPS